MVGFKAQVVNESALFGAQEVAGTPDFKVAKGYFESGSQVAKLFKGLQAFARFLRKSAKGRRDEVAKGLAVAPPNPSAHLVQVAQAKHVRVEYDNGIGIGHVKPVLDDGGAHQYVEPRLHKADDQLLHFVPVHLAVARGNARIGNQALQHSGHLAEVLNAVVDDKDLAASANFIGDGVSQAFFVEAHQVGINGLAVGGRSRHYAEVPRRHERKLQGARNRSRRQRQGVDVGLQCFELVFGVNPKLLLLVDDHEAQVLKF